MEQGLSEQLTTIFNDMEIVITSIQITNEPFCKEQEIVITGRIIGYASGRE